VRLSIFVLKPNLESSHRERVASTALSAGVYGVIFGPERLWLKCVHGSSAASIVIERASVVAVSVMLDGRVDMVSIITAPNNYRRVMRSRLTVVSRAIYSLSRLLRMPTSFHW
jgi:hypothetical protein